MRCIVRVAVIGFNNIKYSPYIRTYTELLDKYKVNYDVIIPNRDQIDERTNGNLISIYWDKTKSKIQNFISFKKNVTNILEKENYGFVFVLTTLPAILLSHVLLKKYRKKYLVDIRDYTYDKMPIFKNIESKVLKHAHTRVISSPAFRTFLPNSEYIICHNFSTVNANMNIPFERHINPIRIGYVGSIAYVKECKRLIDLVKNDRRFCFYLFGNEVNGNLVSDYAGDCGTERVKVFGSYEPCEKSKIVCGIDILFNDYGNDSYLVKCAISNKLYDSFIYKKPLITSPGTVMSKIAGDYSFDIDKNTKRLDELYEWYVNINAEEMVSYMNQSLSRFEKDNEIFEKTVQKIVSEAI